MKHILVAFEERPVSERVLVRSAQLAKAFGTRITVTSVTPMVIHAGRGIGPYDPADPPARHEHEVTKAVARLEELGVRDVTGVPLVGDPADEIVGLAKRKGADLVVLGAHEGGFWSRLLEGSTEDAVAHHSPVDVLIVH